MDYNVWSNLAENYDTLSVFFKSLAHEIYTSCPNFSIFRVHLFIAFSCSAFASAALSSYGPLFNADIFSHLEETHLLLSAPLRLAQAGTVKHSCWKSWKALAGLLGFARGSTFSGFLRADNFSWRTFTCSIFPSLSILAFQIFIAFSCSVFSKSFLASKGAFLASGKAFHSVARRFIASVGERPFGSFGFWQGIPFSGKALHCFSWREAFWQLWPLCLSKQKETRCGLFWLFQALQKLLQLLRGCSNLLVLLLLHGLLHCFWGKQCHLVLVLDFLCFKLGHQACLLPLRHLCPILSQLFHNCWSVHGRVLLLHFSKLLSNELSKGSSRPFGDCQR